MEMKFIAQLTDEQRSQLQRIVDTDLHARARHRAHAVLLSDQGYNRTEIADIYHVKADTVSGWLDAWETHAFQGLYDAPRSGRPNVLDTAEHARALDLIKEHPRQIKHVIHQLANEIGKTVSRSTLKRMISAAQGRWKRGRWKVELMKEVFECLPGVAFLLTAAI